MRTYSIGVVLAVVVVATVGGCGSVDNDSYGTFIACDEFGAMVGSNPNPDSWSEPMASIRSRADAGPAEIRDPAYALSDALQAGDEQAIDEAAHQLGDVCEVEL